MLQTIVCFSILIAIFFLGLSAMIHEALKVGYNYAESAITDVPCCGVDVRSGAVPSAVNFLIDVLMKQLASASIDDPVHQHNQVSFSLTKTCYLILKVPLEKKCNL